MIRALLPAAVKRPLRRMHRSANLRLALRAFRRLADRTRLPREVADRLHYGYGNEGWSASQDFLIGLVAAAWETTGPIVECGCGLSTLLLDHIAGRQGRTVISLEHDPAWAAIMRKRVGPHVQVVAAPLQSYDGFDWYAPVSLPSGIGLVICDGPPSATKGGRFGLLRRLRALLAPDCRILLDDCIRADERRILADWAHITGGTATISADARPYGTLVIS